MNKTAKYLARTLKFFLFCIVILTAFVLIMVAITPEYSLDKVFAPEAEGGMFQDGSFLKIFALFLLFSCIYPALTYVKKEVLFEGTFEDYRDTIIQQFESLGYELESEDAETATFRQKSGFRRFMRMFEDSVTITKGESPLILSGSRKELLRLHGLIIFAIKQNADTKDDPYDFSDGNGN